MNEAQVLKDVEGQVIEWMRQCKAAALLDDAGAKKQMVAAAQAKAFSMVAQYIQHCRLEQEKLNPTEDVLGDLGGIKFGSTEG